MPPPTAMRGDAMRRQVSMPGRPVGRVISGLRADDDPSSASALDAAAGDEAASVLVSSPTDALLGTSIGSPPRGIISPGGKPVAAPKRHGIYIPPPAVSGGLSERRDSDKEDDDDDWRKDGKGVQASAPAYDDMEAMEAAMAKIHRANEIAQELKKQATFKPTPFCAGDSSRSILAVSASLPDGVQRTWDWKTFEHRVRSMERIHRKWKRSLEKGRAFTEPTDTPFSDASDLLIGEASVFLMSLGNMIEHDANAALFAPGQGNAKGSIDVQVRPLDRDGGMGPWEEGSDLDPFVDDPRELLGREISFVIRVLSVAVNEEEKPKRQGWAPPNSVVAPIVPPCKYRGIWVRYKVDKNDELSDFTCTRPCELPPFKWEHHETSVKYVRRVDEALLSHLQTGCITFEVWGRPADSRPPPPRTFTEPNPSSRRPAVQEAEKKERLDRAMEVARTGSCSSLPMSRQPSNPLSPDAKAAVAAFTPPAMALSPPRHRGDTKRGKVCVVCGRQDRPGENRKSGWKCKECIGVPHKGSIASPPTSPLQ